MLPFFITGLLGLLSASLTSASPARNPHLLLPLNEVAVRDPLDVARDSSIEKRISTDFSLNHEWRNQVLFQGGWSDSGDNNAESVSLSVVCRECWTKGDVTARLTTRDIIKPVVRLELGNVEAYVDLAVDVSASAVYAINLFTSNTPVGIGFPGLSVGLVFYVDLVFSASAILDLDGGFYVTLEEDAFLEADIFGGDITDSLFDGIGTKTFPITVRTGHATFKAALRLRVQLGAETKVPLIGISLGGGAVAGVYANIIEFVAEVDTNQDCALETRQSFNLNVGAFARAGFDVDFTSIGVAPTVSTTLFDTPTWTQCWINNAPAKSGLEDGGPVSTLMSLPAVTPVTGLPSLPSFGGQSTSSDIKTVGTTENRASLIVRTTLSTPTDSSMVKPPRPTTTPPTGLASPNSNATVFTPWATELITTTLYSTTEYTLTRCAATVLNCPGSLQSKVVVTKTVDAYTTVCPPGAKVTMPARPSSFDTAEAPAVPAIANITHLRKLVTPIVNTFRETQSEKPTVDLVAASEVKATSISVSSPSVHEAATVIPLASHLPVPVKEESHLSHVGTAPRGSQTKPAASPVGQTGTPTASGSKLHGFWPFHILTAAIIIVILA